MWHELDPEIEGFDTLVITQMFEWGPIYNWGVYERTDFDGTGRRLYWAMCQPTDVTNGTEPGHDIVFEGW